MASGLNNPVALAFTPSGTLTYVLTNSQLLTIPVGGGATAVLAGQATVGFGNGLGIVAMFSGPSGLVVHPNTGVAYISDTYNYRIRTCTPLGLVSTLAGSGYSGSTSTNGAALTATFNRPFGIVMDSTYTYLYVVCSMGNTLRRVDVISGYTTTVAGSGSASSNDGTGLSATFKGPTYEYRQIRFFYIFCVGAVNTVTPCMTQRTIVVNRGWG